MALQSATAGETMSNTFLTHRSYFDAHKAPVELRKKYAGANVIVRIEKSPYRDGYVVRAKPVIMMPFWEMGLGTSTLLLHSAMRHAKADAAK